MAKEKGKQNQKAEKPNRRDFIKKLWAGLGILAGVELSAIAAAFLFSNKGRKQKTDKSKLVTVGAVAEFQPNTVTAFRPGRLFVCRLEDGGFLALSLRCTHLGCSVNWQENEKKFICPCHSSSFDLVGNVLSPPAPQALDMYPVQIQNGQVVVDTAKKLKRKRFKRSQVTYV